MNMSSNSGDQPAKKRKSDAPLPTDQERGDGGGLAEELKAMLKSAVKELMDHSSSQMSSMQNKMDLMIDKMERLEARNVQLEESLQKTHTIVNIAPASDLLGTESKVREQMDSRFDNVEIRLKYQEVMMKNQKWEYAVDRPPPEYWHSIGRNPEDATSLLEQIEQETSKMRHGLGDGEIRMHIDDLPFDRAYMPHWEEFISDPT